MYYVSPKTERVDSDNDNLLLLTFSIILILLSKDTPGFFGGRTFDFNQNIQRNTYVQYVLYFNKIDALQHFEFLKTGFVEW